MTIEKNIARIADALELIAKNLATAGNPSPVVAEAPAPAPAQESPAPVAPAPVQEAPAPVQAAPFTTKEEMTAYVMRSYSELGPDKGLEIQNVLSNLGYGNINDVPPEKYGDLYAGVEALR